MDGGIKVVKITDYALSCKAGRDWVKNEGKLPRISDDIQDAMLNGSSNGGDGDDVHRKDGFHLPCDFFKSFLTGYCFENKLEVKDEGGVILAEINEGDDMFLFLKEVLEVDGCSGEGSGVESWHSNEEVGFKECLMA